MPRKSGARPTLSRCMDKCLELACDSLVDRSACLLDAGGRNFQRTELRSPAEEIFRGSPVRVSPPFPIVFEPCGISALPAKRLR